jgi:hypothetical protein
MMNPLRYLSMFALVLMLLISITHAYSTSSVKSLLSSYSVPSAIINSLTFTNISYMGSNYAALYQGSSLFMVVNVTGSQYSVLLNASQIFNVIKGTTLQNSLSSTEFKSLAAMMHQYQNSSIAPVSDCLNLTGLSRGFSCTLANMCESCRFVPACGSYTGNPLYATGGPTGIFAQGIMQFESSYSSLNSSFNTFYSTLNSMNASSAASGVVSLGTAFGSISNITSSLYKNPIFPPLANITSQQFAICSAYMGGGTYSVNVSAPGAPWYCNAIGYCPYLSYNYTLLGQLDSRITAIMQLPITNQQIMGVAKNASNNAGAYVAPIVGKQKTAELNQIFNTTLLGYPAVVNGSQALLNHVSNQTLFNSLSAMASLYSNVTSNYLSMNLMSANRSLALSFTTLKNAYDKVNSTYSSALNLANNNTALIIEAQLNSRSANQQELDLAYIELAYNNAINGRISNLTYLTNELSLMAQDAQSLYSGSLPLLSATELSRAIDGQFVKVLAPSLGLNYATAVALAPALSSLLSLLIGLLVLGVVSLFYLRLKAKRKLALSHRTRRNWHRVFVIVLVAILIYVIVTYAYASGANAFAPSSAFSGALHGSKFLVIEVNGTSTTSEIACANLLMQKAKSLLKQPVFAYVSNGVCSIGNATTSLSSCMTLFSSNNMPVIVLTNSNSETGMSIYSFYGTYLSVTGNSTYMQSCYPALLLR